MKLQYKILFIIIPFVLLSLLALGLWSFKEARKNAYLNTYRYLDVVIETYINEHIDKNYQLLKEAKLDKVKSYIETYQKDAENKSKTISKIKGGHIFVLNEYGKMVFCSLKHTSYSIERSWGDLSSEIIGKKTDSSFKGVMKKEGFHDIYVARYFNPWGWVIFYSIPADDISVLVNNILFATLGVAVLCAIVGSILIFLFSKIFLVRPIDKISKAASIIASNKDIDSINVKSKDELGILARNMEYMSRAIHRHKTERKQSESLLLEKQEELQNHHDSMEQLVKDRTFELSETNKKLQQEIIDRRLEEEKREKLQFELQQAQKMESIGNLAGGIAHDFNNILSAILGFAQLILDDAKKGSDLEDDIQEIITAGLRARDLISQVLVFARQSDEELIPMRVDLVAKEVLKLIRSSIPTSIEINSKIESKSRIVGNPSQCHQIFMNLCTNAAYAMEQEGGILEVSIMDTELNNNGSTVQWGLSAGEYIKIVIKDTGVGIPKDIIESIFDPFFTTKPLGEGTGMGLSVVHGIVRSYYGKIIAASEPGRGTVFTIYLPITKQNKKSIVEHKKELPKGKEYILIVDDEISITKVIDRTLMQLGYSVTKRNNSIEAMELFKIKPNYFDLVITDMTMPNLTGDKLAKAMIAIRPDIPVILCTGYSKKITDQKALEIGIKALVHKPIINAELANTVRAVLDDAKKMA